MPEHDEAQEIKIKSEEVTFLGGGEDKPDFADIFITIYPSEKVVELKSLKLYLHHFRNTEISYERLISVIYKDFMEVYKPVRLRIVMIFGTRGGTTSCHTKDSDWSILGGKEVFKNWTDDTDTW